MRHGRIAGVYVLAALAAASFAQAGDPTDFTSLAKSRYVHCAFYKGYEKDPLTGDPIMVEGKAIRSCISRMSTFHRPKRVRSIRACPAPIRSLSFKPARRFTSLRT